MAHLPKLPRGSWLNNDCGSSSGFDGSRDPGVTLEFDHLPISPVRLELPPVTHSSATSSIATSFACGATHLIVRVSAGTPEPEKAVAAAVREPSDPCHAEFEVDSSYCSDTQHDSTLTKGFPL